MQKLKSKKVIIMFGGWVCALALILTLTCASLAKYVTGKSSESNPNAASLDCTVETSVRSASGTTASFVNYEAEMNGYKYLLLSNSACVVDYVIANHSEVPLHPYFRIYGSYEFLSKMAFQLAKVATTDSSFVDTAITPQYYMSDILKGSDTWTFYTDDEHDNTVEKLDYAGGEETVTVTKSGDDYTALCKNKTSDEKTVNIRVTQTSVSQGYTIMFSRGVVTTIADNKPYNDKSAKPVYYEATTDAGSYLCLTVEFPNLVLSPGEDAHYACYLVATGNVSQDLLGKSFSEVEETVTFNGWYYDAEITPTSSTEAVTVRIRNVNMTSSYYLVNADGTETKLTKSGSAYSGGGYTFAADTLEKYGDYTYNPNTVTNAAGETEAAESYSLDTSWGIIYPLRATILFEQTQGVA